MSRPLGIRMLALLEKRTEPVEHGASLPVGTRRPTLAALIGRRSRSTAPSAATEHLFRASLVPFSRAARPGSSRRARAPRAVGGSNDPPAQPANRTAPSEAIVVARVLGRADELTCGSHSP